MRLLFTLLLKKLLFYDTSLFYYSLLNSKSSTKEQQIETMLKNCSIVTHSGGILRGKRHRSSTRAFLNRCLAVAQWT